MTRKQALKHAQRRWTPAHAFIYAPHGKPFQVGYCDGWRDVILGFGPTWEDAFRLADLTVIDTSAPRWWGPHPDGIQQRRAVWCFGGDFCTCNAIPAR
jgi:hypothetical protein